MDVLFYWLGINEDIQYEVSLSLILPQQQSLIARPLISHLQPSHQEFNLPPYVLENSWVIPVAVDYIVQPTKSALCLSLFYQ